MEKLKAALDKIFIEGLSAMAQGLFATLIIGTIIQQAGTLIGGTAGDMLFAVGKVAASLTGAGIGAAVAYRFKESPLVVVSRHFEDFLVAKLLSRRITRSLTK